jgi:glycosyltransferase involved in cell wall biosynthesis
VYKDKPYILVFCPYYPPHTGGLETHADGFNRYLSELGFHLSVFTPRLPVTAPVTEVVPNCVRIYRFPAFEIIPNYPLPKFWLPEFWKLLGLAATPVPDITISRTRFFFTSFMSLLYAKIRRTKYIHIEHGSDYVHLQDPLKNSLAFLYDQVFGRLSIVFSDLNIANSKASADFCRRLGFKKDCRVIYRGLDIKSLKNIKAVKGLNKKYPGKTLLFFVGRLYAGKGLRDLLQSLKSFPINTWQLLIAGDGPEKIILEKLSVKLGFAANVNFLGNLDWSKAMAYLKSSDIVLNPSYTEGLPTSVIEAGFCGKPVIATNVGGTAEILGRNYPYLIRPGDIIALTGCLNTLIKKPKSYTKIGKAISREIERKFDWSKNILEYEKLFSSLK